jgi:hypothetical protein
MSKKIPSGRVILWHPEDSAKGRISSSSTHGSKALLISPGLSTPRRNAIELVKHRND